MNKVLLVDDDTELCALQAEYLRAEGFEVAVEHDGERGAVAALSGTHAIVVLDVMMPRVNGVEALRRIRQSSSIPVIMLTARGDDIDRVLGLELGADDYVPKPCTPRELVARIRAILRRAEGSGRVRESHAPLSVGVLSLSPEQRRAEWAGQALDLTSTEFGLLEVLARQAGSPVSKNDLSEKALGRPLARYDRSIDVHVSNLRSKLGVLADGRSPIQTVRGVGYQYILEL
ncbi:MULTISPECIES: response regulator [unclassified Uliginosibacterium]|jgi:DNA-binding response OmpR family regulator|uniref:response regulator n=1 Tax=unclassified Uliginosibacterium TaxID=2621521 RepID=UPI000C7B7EBE|nr:MULTISPECIES: response regulator [unclassified Uliginosibacterium]MDO6386226.1 response regulator [Uliginosibacterium sp. 31-12]PLK49293.1 DNA-binding response regulator [Uliginosibacterium sp. TH139]